MSTNYYFEQESKACPTCGHSDEEESNHIGKSSVGWAFVFRGYRDKSLTSWAEWKEFLKDRAIQDEYGRPVQLEELEALIDSKIHMKTSSHNPTSSDGHPFCYSWFC